MLDVVIPQRALKIDGFLRISIILHYELMDVKSPALICNLNKYFSKLPNHSTALTFYILGLRILETY